MSADSLIALRKKLKEYDRQLADIYARAAGPCKIRAVEKNGTHYVPMFLLEELASAMRGANRTRKRIRKLYKGVKKDE